jgi:hypothetical protein
MVGRKAAGLMAAAAGGAATTALAMLPLVTASPAAAVKSSTPGERPPECVNVTVTDNSGAGPVLYTKWCGSGAGGESAMQSHPGPEIVDGSRLNWADCHSKSNPCVIFRVNSPQS